MTYLPLTPLHDQKYHAADRSIVICNIYIYTGRGGAGSSQEASTFQCGTNPSLGSRRAGGLHH